MGKPKKGSRSVRVRDAQRKVTRAGWVMKRRTATNHRQYKHPTKPGRVTIAGNPGDELDQGTLESIREQMQVTQAEWDEL